MLGGGGVSHPLQLTTGLVINSSVTTSPTLAGEHMLLIPKVSILSEQIGNLPSKICFKNLKRFNLKILSIFEKDKRLKISAVPTDGLPPSQVTPSIIRRRLFSHTLSGLIWDAGAEPQTNIPIFRYGYTRA